MSEWRESKLGDIADIQNGYAFKSAEFAEEGMPIIKIKNIVPPIVVLDDVQFYNGEISEKLKRFLVKKNDFLISMTGSTVNQMASAVGKMSRYQHEHPSLINQRVAKIYSTSELVTDDYLFYFLNRYEVQYDLALSASGSANQANISPVQLKSYKILFPDRPTQKSITEILSSIDDKIELNNRINQELETLAQTLFKQWFINFEFPNENGEPYKSSGGQMVDSELGEMPEGWRVGTLKDEFNLNMGQSPKGDTYNEKNDGIIFFQGRSDFGFRFPSVRVFTNDPKKVAKKFETLISVRAPVGDINMAEYDCCIGRGLGSISHQSELFSYTYYKILSIQEELKSYDNEGTVFGSINKETLGNIKINIPPLSLSNGFDELVKKKDSLIYNLTNENQQLTKLRDVLLPKLISGDLELIGVKF